MRKECNSRKTRWVAIMAAAGITFPAFADVDRLMMTEVDPTTDQVEITNTSTGEITLASDLWFCHQLIYNTSIPASTTWDPGESKVFTLVSNLADTQGDVWLYRSDDFETPSNIITGMQYGAAGSGGRTADAVSVGLWPSTDDFVPLPGSGETMQLNGPDAAVPDDWVSRPETFEAYFGTGTQIVNPLPPIPKGSIVIDLELVADGFIQPLGVVDLGDGRMLVYDQVGVVSLLSGGSVQTTPFLDVSDRLVDLGIGGPGTFDERGLIGFAVHPDFANNGMVYTHTSEPVEGDADFTVPNPEERELNHHAVIAEWTVDSSDPDVIDPDTRRELMRIEQPQFNHNGGVLRFGADGFLYIAIGDGGGADDLDGRISQGVPMFGHGPDGNGQNKETIHGTLARIDVDGNNSASGEYGIPATNPFVGTDGVDEAFAWGFRNPFSFSFDRVTGDLYLGDVGQNDIEEINVVESGGNYGWRLKEGTFFFDPNGNDPGRLVTVPVEPLPDDLIDPIAEYGNPQDGIAVIGGFVYRGSAIPELEGMYVFGDWAESFASSTGRVFYLDPADPEIFEFQIGAADDPLGFILTGIGEDADGELYLCVTETIAPFGETGRVFRVVSEGPTAVTDWLLHQ